MKRLLPGLALLCVVSGVAQQPAPPFSRQPTSPHGQVPTRPTHPPDTKAPAPGDLSNPEIRNAIHKEITHEPLLAKSNLVAAVDDKTVVLSGTVHTKRQHHVALRIAHSYAGDRTIVDKIVVKETK